MITEQKMTNLEICDIVWSFLGVRLDKLEESFHNLNYALEANGAHE